MNLLRSASLLVAFFVLATPRAAVEGSALTSSSAKIASKLRARTQANAQANTNASSALLGGSFNGKGGKAPLGHFCLLDSACESGKCRLATCNKNCKSELDRCYCDKHDERCDECCGDIPFCWQSGINAHKICNRRPKQELTPGQLWDATWKDVIDSMNERGQYLKYDYRQKRPECVNNIGYQGGCGSCWAFASATAAQYRMCAAFDEFSQMDILCNVPKLAVEADDNLCAGGGWPEYGMNFVAGSGVLRRKDFDYPSSAPKYISRSVCDAKPSASEGTRYKFTRGTHYYDNPATRAYNLTHPADGFPGDPGFPMADVCPKFGVRPGCAKVYGGAGCYCDTHDDVRANCKNSCGGPAPFRAMLGNEPNFIGKVKYALLKYGPLPISIQLHNDWEFHTKDPACYAPGGGIPMSRQHDKSCCYKNRGGIYTNKEDRDWCDEEMGSGHSMVITGWGKMNGVDYWQIENSWGAAFNFGGEMRIAMDYLRPTDSANDLEVAISLPKDFIPPSQFLNV